jgi:hypothetical protein
MANGSINVKVITKEMMVMAINDTVQSGAVDAISIINNKDLVGGIIIHYFMSQNLFREILGLPLYVMPENDDEEDNDDE